MLADQLTGILKPDGALLGFFANTMPRDAPPLHEMRRRRRCDLYRPYPAARAPQVVLANRDIIRLFAGLRVSDSFLMKNNVRELLFRKPLYDTR
jgi:hypothetical protein